MRSYNFFCYWTKAREFFVAQHEIGCRSLLAIPIFDTLIRFRYIRGQSLKLPEIAPNFAHFNLPNLGAGVLAPKNLYPRCYACLAARHVEMFPEVTPLTQSYCGLYVEFKPEGSQPAM